MNARVVEETNTRIELRGRLETDEQYNWLNYSVHIDGEYICDVKAYPESPMYDAYIMRLLEHSGNYASIGKDYKDFVNAPALPNEPDIPDGANEEAYMEHLDALQNAYKTITIPAANIAGKIEAFVDAIDKLAGKGVGESVLLHDDTNLTFFNIAFQPIMDAYFKARSKKSGKYYANPKS